MTGSDPHRAARHAVLFAESDDELDEVAGGLLARSLAAGDVVIVLATADHRRLFDDQMKAAGVDLDRARREGMLIALDAAETLERLTPRGAFDLGAFDEVVGELVRSATARGAVQAFGEIVGLLWDLGRVEEAIELEAAWNLLLEESGASLLCAYPSMVVDPQSTHSVLTVCALHSSVLDSAPFARVWHFPAELATVSAARRQVVTALRARGLSGVTLQDVEVAVAELVANAVLHGRSACSVKVELDGDRVRVEVADRNPHLPLPRAVDREASSGRGLHLLSALTDSWGSHMAPQGKVVWTELAR